MRAHDLEEIYQLNQRGGRQLSLLDLVTANTLDINSAAFLAGAVSSGASLLTAARPGNAGKTTLLAALLAFLPPERRILTATGRGALSAMPENTCLLAHEIGSGPYYGYLWGADARRFFEANTSGSSRASCIHADTLPELRDILCGPEIGISAAAFARIDLVAFLHLERSGLGYRRRVAAIYAHSGAPGAEHQQIFGWEAKLDTHRALAPIPARWEAATARAGKLLAELQASGRTEYEAVYRAARQR